MSNAAVQGHITTTVTNGVARIRFYHPAHNAMPGYLLAQLTEAIEQAGQDAGVCVVVLESEGERTFCAGASFDELAAIQDFDTGKRFFLGFANVINAMRRCSKFIVGRVQGKAIGGGVGLASATDYCVATEAASVKLSELAVGIGPFVVGPAVERKMGKAAFTHLAIDAASWQSAEWARQKGLYNEVFPTITEMDAHIGQLCGRLATSNPEAMRRLKSVFWEDAAHWNELLDQRAAVSGQLVLSDYAKSAINAFKQKS
jgi:methylglutaconyl-CoA hydratase